jgi:1,4-dihydroxy-2-naphthoate octaprenyltransferase
MCYFNNSYNEYRSLWDNRMKKHERQKGSLTTNKKNKRELLTDLLVALIVIILIGGMLVYAHFDIMRIVE